MLQTVKRQTRPYCDLIPRGVLRSLLIITYFIGDYRSLRSFNINDRSFALIKRDLWRYVDSSGLAVTLYLQFP